MLPGTIFEVVAQGPEGDCLEVAHGDFDVVVYAWPHSTLSVFSARKLLREYSTPAPATPERRQM